MYFGYSVVAAMITCVQVRGDENTIGNGVPLIVVEALEWPYARESVGTSIPAARAKTSNIPAAKKSCPSDHRSLGRMHARSVLPALSRSSLA